MSSRQWYKVVSARLARRESGGWGRNLAALTLLLLITGASPSLAQELRTAPLTELSYTAGAGQVFELQGSRDLSSWRNVGDVVFGEGGSMREFVEASDAATGYRFYRVKISPSKEFGFAPRALLGRQIDFNDEGGARVFTFETRATGSSGGESFAYNYRKLGDTNGELDIERGDGTSEQIELDFSADLVGLYTRRLSRDGVVTDIDVGTFTFRRTPTDPGGQMPALELDDGSILAETVVICDYLEELNPTPALIGANAQERAEARMWTRRIEQRITENIFNPSAKRKPA